MLYLVVFLLGAFAGIILMSLAAAAGRADNAYMLGSHEGDKTDAENK